MTAGQRFKQWIWRRLYPIFPYFEHFMLFMHKRRRQRYHIGWLAPGKTLEEMKHHLSTRYGFGNHFIAWEDTSQVLSWRKLDGFNYQYHMRVFQDGEIRGHYERTPESAPVDHFLEKGESARTKDFLDFLGEFVTLKKHVSALHRPEHLSPEEREKTFGAR